jgi:hypothetical protein
MYTFIDTDLAMMIGNKAFETTDISTSNVPGPTKPLHFKGREVEEMFIFP